MTRVGWIRLLVVILAVGMLELACRLGAIDHRVMIPPSEMAVALWRLFVSGQFSAEMARTFGIVVAAVLISIVLGFAIGLAIHAVPRLRQALDPFLATYDAVPIFIFYPVLVAIFGLSATPILLMGVATAIVAMIIATLNALDRVPRVLAKVARVHRMGPFETALRLKLPAVAPYLFTGVKLATSYGFIGVIASEFILSPAGLGRVIADAYNDFNNPHMYALILLLLIVATAVNTALHTWDQKWAERRGIRKP